MGLPSASSEFMLDFWQSPPAFVKHTVTDFAMDFLLICLLIFGRLASILGHFGVPLGVPKSGKGYQKGVKRDARPRRGSRERPGRHFGRFFCVFYHFLGGMLEGI